MRSAGIKKELFSTMDEHREELFEMLSGLIQISTENGGEHQPDEFIGCDDLLQIAKIVGQVVLDWDEKNG